MRELFHKFKDNPPISKGQPPVSGKILWSESIFMRVRRPIMKFKEKEDLLESDVGK